MNEIASIARSGHSWAIAIGALAFGGFLAQQQSEPGVVRATRIELLDSKGEVKAWLATDDGMTTLVFLGENETIAIGAGQGGMQFLDPVAGSPRSSTSPAAFLALSVKLPDGKRQSAVIDVGESRVSFLANTARSYMEMGVNDRQGAEPLAAINLVAEGKGDDVLASGGIFVTPSRAECVIGQGEEREASFYVAEFGAGLVGRKAEDRKPFGIKLVTESEAVIVAGGSGKEAVFP